MTDFRQRMRFLVPRYWLNAGILTPFPFIAPKPDKTVFTARGPLFDLRFHYSTLFYKLQEPISLLLKLLLICGIMTPFRGKQV